MIDLVEEVDVLISKFDTLTPSMKKMYFYKRKPFKFFYNLLVPRSIRKNTEEKAKLKQQQHLAECWCKLIDLHQQGLLSKIEIKPKKEFNHQKIIWQYWGQGIDNNLPDIVRLCFASVDKYKHDYLVIRLDDNNLQEYLEFPDFIWEKRKNPEFKPVFFSDLLRLALLYYYGGVWVDATILLTNYLDKRFLSSDFFAFQRSMQTPNKEKWNLLNRDYFSWDESHKVKMLSSILFAKKNNPFVYDWLQLILFFWQNQKKITHYFFFQILFNEIKSRSNHLDNMLLIDDTLPHLLVSKLNQPFDEQDYQNILSQINIHKLTYVKECISGSYYEYLQKSMEVKCTG